MFQAPSPYVHEAGEHGGHGQQGEERGGHDGPRCAVEGGEEEADGVELVEEGEHLGARLISDKDSRDGYFENKPARHCRSKEITSMAESMQMQREGG